MLRVHADVLTLAFCSYAKEDLLVAQGPVTEDIHQARSILQHLQSLAVQLGVIHGWLLVEVSQAKPFDDVHVEDTKESDGVKDGNEHAVHEAHVDLHDDGGVFKMNDVIRSSVQVDVLLERDLLGPELGSAFPAAKATTVKKSEDSFHRKTYCKFNVWKDCHHKHRSG